NKRKSDSKPDRNKRRFEDNKDDFLTNNDGNLTGAELLADDGVATPGYYQHQFDSQFKSSNALRGDRGADSLTKMSSREVAAANMVGMGDLVPEHFSRNNPSTARLQNFQNLLSQPGAGNSTQNGLGNLSGGALSGPASGGGLISSWNNSTASPVTGNGLSDAFSSGNVNSSLESLNAGRSLNGSSVSFGASGFAPSGLGGNAFQLNAAPAAAPTQKRPIFFEIPKRNF
ncbi:MAG: hypothetical protein HOH33_09095, partial [Verrucomicrobia bacterium]|nr:hypothetical protein [Verrucomicrobiota bacterium]